MKGRLLLALAVCGCTGMAGTRPAGWGASSYLLGAEEETTIIAQPEKEAVPGGEEVAGERSWMLGVRLGMFAPNDSSEGYASYRPGPFVGAFYRGLQLAEKSIAWELGAEYASAEANQLHEDANLLSLRASVLYGKWYSESSIKLYASAGGTMLVEEDATGGAFTAGLGVGLKGLDVRFGVFFLLGSKNASTVTTATVGYLF